MTNFLLYASTVLIWGSTWLAIKYQLGVVAPEVAIAYRFAIATVILFAFCVVTGRRLRFSRRDHAGMALQGILLFSLNYFVFYLATFDLTTGLIAVVFSTMVIMNTLFGALFFGSPIRPRVMAGGLVGLAGLALVFLPELRMFDLGRQGTLGLLLSFLGSVLASLGNMASVSNQRRGLPVLQTNAWGMGYGTLVMVALALFGGKPFNFDTSFPFTASLLYLGLFGSVFAFGCYLTLLGRIGADRAAYATVLFPIIALGLSTWFEDYQWTSTAGLGIALVVAGNVLALSRVNPLRRAGAEEAS